MALGDVALDGVGQGVHAGGGGQALGHAAHHVWIDHGDLGDIVGVHADELALLFHVGDDVIDGDLRGGAGGGGHGDGEHGVLLGGGNALQGAHVLKLGIVDDDADGLGGIHAGAAADGDDAVRAALLEVGDAGLHVFNGGIGLDFAVDLVGEAGLLQQVGDLGGHAELDQVRVGAHEGLLIAARGQLRHDVFNSAAAVIGNGVQYDAICHGNTRSFLYFAVARKPTACTHGCWMKFCRKTTKRTPEWIRFVPKWRQSFSSPSSARRRRMFLQASVI